MKANALMKRNIDALLTERRLSRKDLAQWCYRGESWISKIMKEDRREFPMKYWDRIADFFGVAPYQLLQPGIGGVAERRRAERRSGKDRRVSALNQRVRISLSEAVASLSQTDVADMIRLKALSAESREAARIAMQELERSEQQAVRRGHIRPSAVQASGAATTRASRGKKSRADDHDGTEG
jgi:hypothetical protein